MDCASSTDTCHSRRIRSGNCTQYKSTHHKCHKKTCISRIRYYGIYRTHAQSASRYCKFYSRSYTMIVCLRKRVTRVFTICNTYSIPCRYNYYIIRCTVWHARCICNHYSWRMIFLYGIRRKTRHRNLHKKRCISHIRCHRTRCTCVQYP